MNNPKKPEAIEIARLKERLDHMEGMFERLLDILLNGDPTDQQDSLLLTLMYDFDNPRGKP